MTQGIYSILYRPDGRSYIGATKNIEIRFKAHKQNLMDGKHHNAGLQEAFDGASLEDFEFSILEVVGNKDRLNDREQYWMAQQLQLFNSPRATPYCLRLLTDYLQTPQNLVTQKMHLVRGADHYI